MAEMQKHIPVMLNEVLQALKPKDNAVYVDATFGNGGYTKAILQAANCKVIAIDQDPNVVPQTQKFAQEFGSRFVFMQGNFGNLGELIEEQIDGIVFDIGVSSMQIDEAERGFSFAKEAPLDMRMSCCGKSAKDLVNTLSEKELADILFKFGEEKKSRQIARAIVEKRKTSPICTTLELAQIIYEIVHKKFGQPDPATRTFQALRIAVNDELIMLEKALNSAVSVLKSGAPLVVVDFHSLEDRIVKNFFKEFSGKSSGVSRYMPAKEPDNRKVYFTECSKVILPSQTEIAQNKRAHSAKLRFAVKL